MITIPTVLLPFLHIDRSHDVRRGESYIISRRGDSDYLCMDKRMSSEFVLLMMLIYEGRFRGIWRDMKSQYYIGILDSILELYNDRRIIEVNGEYVDDEEQRKKFGKYIDQIRSEVLGKMENWFREEYLEYGDEYDADLNEEIRCLCGKTIHQLCYLVDEKSNTAFLVGNTCIGKISNELRKKLIKKIDESNQRKKGCTCRYCGVGVSKCIKEMKLGGISFKLCLNCKVKLKGTKRVDIKEDDVELKDAYEIEIKKKEMELEDNFNKFKKGRCRLVEFKGHGMTWEKAYIQHEYLFNEMPCELVSKYKLDMFLSEAREAIKYNGELIYNKRNSAHSRCLSCRQILNDESGDIVEENSLRFCNKVCKFNYKTNGGLCCEYCGIAMSFYSDSYCGKYCDSVCQKYSELDMKLSSKIGSNETTWAVREIFLNYKYVYKNEESEKIKELMKMYKAKNTKKDYGVWDWYVESTNKHKDELIKMIGIKETPNYFNQTRYLYKECSTLQLLEKLEIDFNVKELLYVLFSHVLTENEMNRIIDIVIKNTDLINASKYGDRIERRLRQYCNFEDL